MRDLIIRHFIERNKVAHHLHAPHALQSAVLVHTEHNLSWPYVDASAAVRYRNIVRDIVPLQGADASMQHG